MVEAIRNIIETMDEGIRVHSRRRMMFPMLVSRPLFLPLHCKGNIIFP